MLVVLLGSFANSQTLTPSDVRWHSGTQDYTILNTRYRVPEQPLRVEFASFANGTFDWSWTESQLGPNGYDPLGYLPHRSNFTTQVTRNGQSGFVSFVVTLEEVGPPLSYLWAIEGTTPTYTSNGTVSSLEEERIEARAHVQANRNDVVRIWKVQDAIFTATVGSTNLRQNGGAALEYLFLLDEVIVYDEPDVWSAPVFRIGSETGSSTIVVDESIWSSPGRAVDFGPDLPASVNVFRVLTRIPRGTVRELLTTSGGSLVSDDSTFTSTIFNNTGAVTPPNGLEIIHAEFATSVIFSLSTLSIGDITVTVFVPNASYLVAGGGMMERDTVIQGDQNAAIAEINRRIGG